MKQITRRLLPNQDLKQEIEKVVQENNVKAGVVLSLVGSLSRANLRMAGAKEVKTYDGPLEIVSATGTVSINDHHIHIAVSDKNGPTFGGHLKEGCIVRTSVELVILAFDDIEYTRTLDPQTGYKELEVRPPS